MVVKIKQLIKDANESTVISELIDINMKLCGYMAYLCDTESELLKEKLIAYNEKKDFMARYCLSSEEGITKAEKASIVFGKPYITKEMETEVAYQAARSFRSQVSEFCQALIQKIAFLRQEQSNTKYQSG